MVKLLENCTDERRVRLALGVLLVLAIQAGLLMLFIQWTGSSTTSDHQLPAGSLHLGSAESATHAGGATGHSVATPTPAMPMPFNPHESAALRAALPLGDNGSLQGREPLIEPGPLGQSALLNDPQRVEVPAVLPRLGSRDDVAPWESWPAASHSGSGNSGIRQSAELDLPAETNGVPAVGARPSAARLRGVIQ